MELPSRIGKYELLEHLGGGMSEVYRARDTVLGRTVVVKILTREASSDAEARARFLREAQVAANIHHEHIVAVHDYGEEQGRPYIVMEFLVGQDLRKLIREGRAGSLGERLRIALNIAQALGYIHSLDIVHRDVKPENVHVDGKGRVKLMDFGIAKPAGLSLTRTGIAMGTPYYMAPEQVTGKPVTALADIYAFGVLFYELLTGARAFEAETVEALFFQILKQPIDRTRLDAVGAPAAICDLILRCAEKEAADRPKTFDEVSREIQRVMMTLEGGTTQPLPVVTAAVTEVTKPAEPRSRWPLYAAIGGVVVIAAAGLGWWKLRPPPPIPGMLYIEAGTFLAGAEKKPETLKGFYIDETEVSNGEFRPGVGDPDLPATRVTIAEARAFCSSKGKRLPTALEWERAARGTQGNIYPWGDTPDEKRANIMDNTSLAKHDLMPVKSFEKYGVWNMAGNVWEMVEGYITPSARALVLFAGLNPPATASEPWITARGGSYRSPIEQTVTYEWTAIPERYSQIDIGFRCAKDP
jgi:serine/threonine-protein kinase